MNKENIKHRFTYNEDHDVEITVCLRIFAALRIKQTTFTRHLPNTQNIKQNVSAVYGGKQLQYSCLCLIRGSSFHGWTAGHLR